jgi:hypothetical protein
MAEAETAVEAEPTGGVGRSCFAATCTRRLRVGTIATALGLVVLIGVGVRLDAEWVLTGAAIALATGFVFANWYGRSLVETLRAQATRSVAVQAIQPSIDALARRAGIAPPLVEVDAKRTVFACSVDARFRILFTPAKAVDALVLGEADEREDALASIAHELGHARRPLPHVVTLSARAVPIVVPCTALLTFSLRSWALLTAASYLFVCLPARWTIRWAERAADETARELGYGAAAATHIERSRSPSRWWGPGLATHPSKEERVRRLRA